MGASFVVTLLMLKKLSTVDFVMFQTILSCFVILYWIIDLGTIDLIVLSKTNRNLVSKYSSGRTFRYYLITIFASVLLYFAASPLISMIMIAVSLDYFNDSMITYRTVRTSLKYLTLTLITRKFIPLFYLIFGHSVGSDNFFPIFLLITIISNLPWVLIDTFKLPFSIYDILYSDKKSKLNTIQQGGNFLQNLDVPLLNLLNFSSVIPLFVLGKRLLQVSSIFGQFQVPMIIDTDVEGVNLKQLRKKISSNFLYTCLLSFLICSLIEVVSQKTNYFQFSTSERMILYFCLIISTLSILTLQQNALLKALHRFETLSYATFSSTFAYLFAIFVFLSYGGERWFFLIALFINYCVEIAVQEFGFKRKVK